LGRLAEMGNMGAANWFMGQVNESDADETS
jgi:hypothetical protein